MEHACPNHWREELSLPIFPDVCASPQKILWKGQILRRMQGELTPRAGVLFRCQSASHACVDVLANLFPSGSYYLT